MKELTVTELQAVNGGTLIRLDPRATSPYVPPPPYVEP